ncbi:MAG: Choline-sulfatase [Anaerolineales bacterium]|nr:Choline-sulfatase [Anaerolineales bacterium]
MNNWCKFLLISFALCCVVPGCVGSIPSSEVLLTPRPTLTLTPKADVVVLPKAHRPNILLILLDDLDTELHSTDYMSNFHELLVEQGLSLENFYVSNPQCCPSRTTILRGQYSHNNGVLTNTPPFGGFETFYLKENESSTVATWLQAAGYKTVLLGKYLNGYPFRENRNYFPIGWTEWYSPAKGKPYVGFNYTLNQNGVQVDYKDTEQGQSLYITDVLSEKTVDFIRRSAQDSSPFFIYLSLYAPHQPAAPARRHEDLFPDLVAPRSPSFNEEDVSDKTGTYQFNTSLTEDQIAGLDELYRNRIRTLQAADELIAQVIDALEETGELESTYVIFTSDNGFHLGQHRLNAGKGTLFEEDIHVPFAIRGPGIVPGSVVRGYLAGNVDIAPTLADLAGVVPPDYIDGRSLMPLFHGTLPLTETWRSAYFLETYRGGAEEEETENDDALVRLMGSFGLRTLDYLYVESDDRPAELYDMKNDPYQLMNIAPTTEPAFLAQLSEWLNKLKNCAADECRTLDRIELEIEK